MSSCSSFELHALNLGKLIGNLLTIEMAARMFLSQHEEQSASKSTTQLPTVKEGDFVEIDAFTNPDDLRQTLNKYNKRVSSEYKVATSEIVSLRDALAHGRAFGFGSKKHLRLLKFGRKKNDGKVPVELVQDMNDEWFIANIKLLNITLEKLTQALKYEKRELL